MAHSKRYTELKAMIDEKKVYPLSEALDLIQKTATTKFDSSIEVHLRLGIDPKKGEQQVRGTVSLPNGSGKTKKVAAFVADSEKAKDAKDAGADLVGGEELIAQINTSGKCDFDVAVATPDMMPKLAKIAKVLGPKGLMPSPKNDTVSPNIKKIVEELKRGKVAFKNDDTGNIHQSIGKASFSKEKLEQNYAAFMEAIRRAKPGSAKGVYVASITMTSTMGPAIKVAQ